MPRQVTSRDNHRKRVVQRTVTTSVLAVDMVSYSREFDENQARLVATLNEVVLRAIAEAKARRPILLPTGDGVIVVLRGQSAAVAVAIAKRIHLLLKDGLFRLALRMGIHEGQGVAVRDINQRENIAGDVINLSQRVMDIGDAEHILLSESAYLSLRNAHGISIHLSPLPANPIEVKHGLRLNVFNFADGTAGNTRTPTKVAGNIGVSKLSIGRPNEWSAFVNTSKQLRVMGHCLRLLASPDFQHKVEELIREGTVVQFAMLNSLSPVFICRERSMAYKSDAELADTFEFVFKSLVDLRARIRRLNAEAVTRFDVRLFDAVPTIATFITDERAYVSVYIEHLLGSMGPYFECNRVPGRPSMYEVVDKAFDEIWEHRAVSIFDPRFVAKQRESIERIRRMAKHVAIPDFQNAMPRRKRRVAASRRQ